MNVRFPLSACAAVAIALVAAPSTHAATADRKFVHPSACVPYQPDTTAAEIEYSPVGIYNPGTQIEKVICPLPRDQETKRTSGQLNVGVYYRGFAPVDARITCTLTVGSTSMQSNAVYTLTASSTMVKNGARGEMNMVAGAQPDGFLTVPESLVCALSPKISLGGVYYYETGTTNTP